MTSTDGLCVQCARQGRTCCQWSEIYVSRDVGRIARHAGREDFYEFAAVRNPDYEDPSDDPVWTAHVFRADGTRRVLKKRPSGDCLFLGPEGCVLALSARPLICRLYPFTYDADGIRDELDAGCPSHLLAPGESLPTRLGMNREAARDWHRLLYEEILHDDDDHRADL